VNEQVQKARRLISAVRLTEVRLIELHAKTSIRSPEITEDMMPVFRHWATASTGLKDGLFYVKANLDVRIGSEDKPQVVSVKIQYELEYALPEEFKATRTELNAFAKVNGVFNAWPYFREIVQSATQRMDLPPVVLPVFRVPATQPQSPPSPSVPTSNTP
jgi:preprotein translocase subunit SecB